MISSAGFSQTAMKTLHPKLNSSFQRYQNNIGNTALSGTSTSFAMPPGDNSKAAVTSLNNADFNQKSVKNNSAVKEQKKVLDVPVQQPMYRDTRLGSSSKMYDTYEKNDYGAGAITNNPNK